MRESGAALVRFTLEKIGVTHTFGIPCVHNRFTPRNTVRVVGRALWRRVAGIVLMSARGR